MSDNFDDIELYQSSQGEVQKSDPNFLAWLLRVVSLLRSHLVSLQAQIDAAVASIQATGTKGDKGDKGDQGIQGPKGPRGLRGLNGINGTNGGEGTTSTPGSSSCLNLIVVDVPVYTILAEPCGTIFSNGAV